jgi:DNA-binding HxlR family transcriptional regulator
MSVKKRELTPQCSVDYAFQRIGGKHKGRILWQLSRGVMRYGQLRKGITGITAKMLTQSLRELEDDGLITRQEFIELPPRVEYQLTASGHSLIPFISLLSRWAEQEMQQRNIPIMMFEKEVECLEQKNAPAVKRTGARKPVVQA